MLRYNRGAFSLTIQTDHHINNKLSDTDCWDGINEGNYMGREVSQTVTGKTCKPWKTALVERKRYYCSQYNYSWASDNHPYNYMFARCELYSSDSLQYKWTPLIVGSGHVNHPVRSC